MTLSDQDVQKQISQMVAFIQQDAKEKANEITQKAIADYNLEKNRMINVAKTRLDAEKEKKLKQIELQRKIHISTQINQQRLKVLKHREEHIGAVIDEARVRLAKIAQQDPNLLAKIMRGLVTQCLFQLLENEVELKCRRNDVNLLQQVVPEAVEKYKQATKRSVNVTIANNDYLPDDQIGVEAVEARGRRIRVVNTLDSRLATVKDTKMPEIRQKLFPKSKQQQQH
ncbi:V-type proton ATPase subunit E-like [Symsagittifera roscoffensis]|uniref:V-type proton ATPase subunit E-like n=1 Tax=Symsagittifera roscoffensis TaxID=84072 RepID=UPI00307B688B